MKSRWNLQSALHLKAYILLLLKKQHSYYPSPFSPFLSPYNIGNPICPMSFHNFRRTKSPEKFRRAAVVHQKAPSSKGESIFSMDLFISTRVAFLAHDENLLICQDNFFQHYLSFTTRSTTICRNSGESVAK